jgi:hypothetical protein
MTELPDEPLRAHPNDEEAWAYERMVERLLREEMVGYTGGTVRTVQAVEVRGHYPSAQVVVSFRQDDGTQGEGEWELWEDGSMIGDFWEAPSWVVKNITASWFRPDVERVTPPAPRQTDDEATRPSQPDNQ